MDPRKLVMRQSALISVGDAIGTALMIGVFALIGKFDLSVLWGALAGWLITTLNFFFMAITASIASDKAVEQDVATGKKLIKASQTYRLLGVGAALVLCAMSKQMNLIALVMPLLLVRPILLVAEFFRKKG